MDKKEYEAKTKEIRKAKNLAQLTSKYEEFYMTFSCKPNCEDYPLPHKGDVLDEDKSVKWNREEVERLRANYHAQVVELNRQKNELNHEYTERIIALLGKENGISTEESRIIWRRAYEDGHSNGVRCVIDVYSDLVEMYNDLLQAKESK